MRFQVPTLAVGLFASLVLSADERKVRIETRFDGPGDDATQYCVVRLEGLCNGTSAAATTSEKFSNYNEETQRCESTGPERIDVCKEDGDPPATIDLRGDAQGPGKIMVIYEKDELLTCDLENLSPDAECTLKDPEA